MTAQGGRSVPAELEEYRIVRLLGRGGMGEVYLAEDRLLARLVAIKIIASSTPAPAARARFFVEARAVARLSHPNVVAVYRVGEVRRQPFLVSEYVRGQSLAELAKPLPWRRALEIAVGLARGLAAAHRRGVLHRDLKPGNAMLSEDGTVKLLDFGLAELSPEGASFATDPPAPPAIELEGPSTVDLEETAPDRRGAGSGEKPSPVAPAQTPSLDASSERLVPTVDLPSSSLPRAAGTPLYMAPEIWRGEPATPSADVYALGVVLYELCTGRPPYGRLTLPALRFALTEDDPPPLAKVEPGVDPRFASLVDRCLRRDPALRFGDGDALREALEQIAAPAGLHARRRMGVGLSAAAVLLAGLGLYTLEQRRHADEQAQEVSAAELTAERRERDALDQARRARDLARVAVAGRPESGATMAALMLREVEGDPAAVPGWLAAVPFSTPAYLTRRVLKGHQGEVHDVAWGPHGRRVATASSDGTARLWDPGSGGHVVKLQGHTSEVVHVAFSPDGTRVVTASADGTARLWTLDGTPVAELTSHGGQVHDAAFSPDGTRVVTASSDGTARVWMVASGALLAELRGHTQGVRSAAWSSTGTRLVTASDDATARVWNADAGASIAVLEGHQGEVLGAAFGADDARVVTASADGTARVWKAAGGPSLATLRQGMAVTSAGFDRGGTHIVTAGEDHTARLWSADGAPLHTLVGHTQAIVHAAFSPDGSHVLTASSDGTAKVWSTARGTLIATLAGHENRVTSAAFSRDGRRVVTGSADGTARVWEAAERLASSRAQDEAPVLPAALRVEGTQVFTGDDDTPLTALDGLEGEVVLAALSADGDQIATVARHRDDPSAPDTLRVWSTVSGEPGRLERYAEGVLSIGWSPDGGSVVTASKDGTARVWSVDGAHVAALRGHTSAVTSAVFSARGDHLVTASQDHTVRVWKVDGTLVAVLAGPEGQVLRARFSADGTSVVATGADGTDLAWIIDPALVQRALWLSTPHCPDAVELRRLLDASEPASDAAYRACEHMSACLRAARGEPMESRYPACFAAFREEQARAER